MKANNPFNVLKNEQLSSVVFIQDYLQLDFDGKKLTCYEWPKIVLPKCKVSFGDVEYRNILCSLITKQVNNTTLIDDETLEINFESGEQIKFELKYATGEVIYFTTPEGEWSSI